MTHIEDAQNSYQTSSTKHWNLAPQLIHVDNVCKRTRFSRYIANADCCDCMYSDSIFSDYDRLPTNLIKGTRLEKKPPTSIYSSLFGLEQELSNLVESSQESLNYLEQQVALMEQLMSKVNGPDLQVSKDCIEEIMQNHEVFELADRLHKRISALESHNQKLGEAVDSANSSYEGSVADLASQINAAAKHD